ncbi:MAG: hypothetical protein P1P84_02855 [Deferrisomatales bacterium]|nr:hypothetical protein [Deferrisomatales bacterium]
MSAHDDYLDPDRYLGTAEDWGWDDMVEALQQHSTHRWDYEPIHCCLTGKDADLESQGQQGIELTGLDDECAQFTVHAGKTFVGADVSLNVDDSTMTNAEHKAAVASYLEQAQEVVCGIPFGGEWDGDSWYITHEDSCGKVDVVYDDDDAPDYEATAQAIIDEANRMLETWELEIRGADAVLDQIAGWADEEGNRLPCVTRNP